MNITDDSKKFEWEIADSPLNNSYLYTQDWWIPLGLDQRNRITAAEWHALDRRLAVARLKEELAPRVKRWRIKRWLRRLVGL